jgi:hypothetical protein
MNPTESDFGQLIAQRNQAVACALLSIAISLSLVASTFVGHRKDLVEAHNEIRNLQSSLIATQNALKENEDTLLNLQRALANPQPHQKK